MKKRFKDRRDARRVDNVDGLHKMIYYIKPHRCDADVYINYKFDVTNLVKYMKNNKKANPDLTYFHAFSTVIAKAVYHRPLMNRFVIAGKYYDRNDLSLSFAAKTSKTDDAKEFVSVVKIDPEDNIFSIEDKFKNKVHTVRSNKKNNTDNAIKIIGKLPRFMVRFVVWLLKKLDNIDLLPESLTKDDLYHSSVLISNLGSIDCGAIYHNLTDFGTNSIVVTIGKIEEIKVGKETKYECEFGINLDERIADGVYMVNSVKLMEKIMQNPELLNDKIKEKVEK